MPALRALLPIMFFACIMLFGATSHAAEPSIGKTASAVFTLKGGIIGGGEVAFDRGAYERSFDLVTATSFGAGFEIPSRNLFTIALTADMHQIDPEYMDSRTMFDIGVALKTATKRNGTLVRPWIGLSYGHVTDFNFWAEASSYLILKGGVELDFFARHANTGFLVDFGLLGSLRGKAGDDDVSSSIRPLIRLGVIFRG